MRELKTLLALSVLKWDWYTDLCMTYNNLPLQVSQSVCVLFNNNCNILTLHRPVHSGLFVSSTVEQVLKLENTLVDLTSITGQTIGLVKPVYVFTRVT